MAFPDLGTYADLLVGINGSGAWLHRSELGTIAPIFVTLCEATMNQGIQLPSGQIVDGLRTYAQETSGTVAISANGTSGTLPTDFLELRGAPYIIYSGIKQPLKQVSMQPMTTAEQSQVAGIPQGFYIKGSTIVVVPSASSATTVYIDYYAKIGPLATSSTNWLLTLSPMTYLYGSIAHGAPWFGPSFNAAPWMAGFIGAMEGVRRSDNLKRNANVTMGSEIAAITSGGRPFNILTGLN